MKFYEFGDESKPSIMLLPGTCCHWKNNFGHVVNLLSESFYVICASYDGFDETENSKFIHMITETEKIEQYINDKLNGRIHAVYGCSLGGSFIGLLMQRNNIHMNHGILGSSDLDQVNEEDAIKKADRIVPFIYKIIKGDKINYMLVYIMKIIKGRQIIDFLLRLLFGVGSVDVSFVTEDNIRSQYISDLVTNLDDGIYVTGTKIHCFYASKMGSKYLERYNKHFKDANIIKYNLHHEELLGCRPYEWVEEVKKCVF